MSIVPTQNGVSYGRRLLPVLVDELDPERLFARVPKSAHFQDGFIDVTYRSFARAVNRAAGWLEDTLGKSSSFQTLAYLGPPDIRYCIFILGACKAGYKNLLLSPRNSLDGQLSLMKRTDCKAILAPKGYKLQQGLLDDSGLPLFEVAEIVELLAEGEVRDYIFSKGFDEAKDDPLVVVHTSGSTGLPKPIVLSHGWVAAFDRQQYLGPWKGYVQTSTVLMDRHIFCSIPPFHVFGLVTFLAVPLLSGPESHIVWPPVGRPVNTATVEEVLDSEASGLTIVTAPSIVEELVQFPEIVAKLGKIQGIVTGPLSRDAGNTVRQKTKMMNVFGTTEVGPALMWFSEPEDWQYFHYNPAFQGIEFRHMDDGLYEQVIVRHPSTDPYHATFNTFPDLQEYATNDLYMKHPTKENLWLYTGRADDVIVLSNGEKLNPTSMESALVGHLGVRGALVVGQARFAPAAIIELEDELAAKLQGGEGRQEMIDAIWPYVVDANKSAPAHAQLSRDMIMFAKPGKPFLRLAKGTVQRKTTVKLYEEEIEELYKDSYKEDLENIHRIDLAEDISSVETALGLLIANALGVESLSAEEDFFASGMDSLQVMKAARQLEAALGGTYTADSISRLLYSNATVAALAATLKDTPEARANVTGQAAMLKTLEKYRSQLPVKSEKPDGGLVAVLTGSTGSLGSYLLDALATSRNITKIYCLNRRADAEQQQAKTNADRGLISEWGNRVIFLHADLSKSNLGLTPQEYDCLKNEAGVIIHNQWQVNFNLALSSFESHITGALNLIKLSSESHFSLPIFFTSSIGTLGNWATEHPGTAVPEVPLEDPSISMAQGYSESKWVTEMLLKAAGEQSGVPSAVLRVGQIAGPVNTAAGKSGMWNKQEWLPTIIQSSLYLKLLPSSLGGQDAVTWIPVDILASIIVELVSKDCLLDRNDDQTAWTRYYHLENPHNVQWSAFLPVIQSYYASDPLSVVSMDKWVEELEASGKKPDADPTKNPGLKLMGMFQGLRRDKESMILDTTHTCQRSEVMQGLQPVNQEWMRLWLQQWNF